jgi:putative ABC transport system permease protein
MRRWRTWLTWRPALRIARREAVRAKGRSALVLVMIALPVLAVVAADVLSRTAAVTTVEGLDRQLGRSDAMVRWNGDLSPVDQSPTLDTYGTRASATAGLPRPTGRTITDVLPGARVVAIDTGQVAVRTRAGVSRPAALEVDGRRPLTRGLFDLQSGRYPRGTGEVAVTPRLAARGFGVGSTLRYDDGSVASVVGLVEPTSSTNANLVLGLPGTLPLAATDPMEPGHRSWLVALPGGVSWSDVRALNARGLQVLSRQVVEHPPAASQVTMRASSNGLTSSQLAVVGMIVAMALLEVVLLAGPAFAVGARRQERSLALIASTGGTPRDVGRVVLASGVVLGLAAAMIGALGGIGVAWLAEPFVQRVSSRPFGPFEVAWRDVAVIAACGLLSALLAAVAPAVMAARQDVVAVLAGRRGRARRPRWSPVAGAVLLGLGVLSAVAGARRTGIGEATIAGSAILAVLGMVLLVPLVVSQLGRGSARLALPLRFAMRDAARQRGRTAPAVAAVGAVVAGVVALGIGAASDNAQNRATYAPRAPLGVGVVTSYSPPQDGQDPWPRLARSITAQLPGARVQVVHGLPEAAPSPSAPTLQRQLTVDPVGAGRFTASFSNWLGSAFLVGRPGLRALGLHVPAADLARAEAVLARGGVVVLGQAPAEVHTVTATVGEFDPEGGPGPADGRQWRFPATLLVVSGTTLPTQAVVSPAVARITGFPVVTSSLLVRGVPIDQASEDAVNEAVQGVDPNASLYVERGFHDSSTSVALLVLGLLGAVLVLGGTLTATFLALSDARPDFATMGAVGAGPRTRRLVASSYALAIGLVGAVLGAVVGAVPGIAVTYPLTSHRWLVGTTDAQGKAIPDHFLDVPWLLVGVVVIGLPLLSAVIVALATRSRLPMVSRLS